MTHSKNYPPQPGPYILKVKSEQSTGHWQDFDTARLQISVGKDYHEGEKFRATVLWCRDRFQHIQICLNDTLQRHNLAFEQSLGDEQASQQSLRAGDAWISRNFSVLSQLPSYELFRWEEWRTKDDFKVREQKFWNLYKVNVEFRDSLDRNIEEIWDRRCKNNPVLMSRRTSFFETSRTYLLEELAIFSMMFEQSKAIDVYPGSGLLATTVFRGKHLSGAPEGLGKRTLCRIDFQRRDPAFFNQALSQAA